ncbi:hypothetical protein ACIBHY_29950 [Nonomuraea sp. NPDC050547]|uniref:hypothetical protein n=1 Tax=Nonomuraea sp. NPDC050547 TaxID=3364368 RepID=UPI0037B6E3BD
MIAHTAPPSTPPTLADAGTPIYDQLLSEHSGLFDRESWSGVRHRDQAAQPDQTGIDTAVIPRITAANPWFTPRLPAGAAA